MYTHLTADLPYTFKDLIIRWMVLGREVEGCVLRIVIQRCIIFLICFIPVVGAATQDKVAIVAPASHHAIVHRIEASLYAKGPEHPNVVWVDPSKISEYHLDKPCDCHQDLALIITVGPMATRKMLEHNPQVPILSVLVFKSTFEDILCEYDISLEEDERRISAVYLDQPFERSIQLANLLIPKEKQSRRVGMVLGPSSSLELQRYQVESQMLGLELNAVIVSPNENPVIALNHVLEDSDVLLAIPDQHVFNTQTARGMLLTAYRKKIPVAGYSQTYVKMGALSALYVTPKQVANQVVKVIDDFLETEQRRLPAPQLANSFSVTVNSHVARLLKRGILSESIIKHQLDALAVESDYIGRTS